MKSLFAICSMIIIVNTTTAFNTLKDPDTLRIKCTEQNNEVCSLINQFTLDIIREPAKIEEIYVYEVEEDISFDFETEECLPKDFNPLKGIGDLNWESIELIELEEEVTIDFDTKQYLPKEFNALKGIGDLDWSEIELIEIEEEVEIDYNTELYLPANFK